MNDIQRVQESTEGVAIALLETVGGLGDWDDVAVQIWVTPEGTRVKLTGGFDGDIQEIGDRDAAISMLESLEEMFLAYRDAGDAWTYACVTVNEEGFTADFEYGQPDSE